MRKEYLKKIEKRGGAYGVLVNTHLFKIANALNVDLAIFFDNEDDK